MGDYLRAGNVFGCIAAFLTFFGAYIYCVATYGFLLGLCLGWLPAAILAALVWLAVLLLWGPMIVGLGLLIYFAVRVH